MKTTSRILSLVALVASFQASAQEPTPESPAAETTPAAVEAQPVPAATPAATPESAPTATPEPAPQAEETKTPKPDAELEKTKPAESPKSADTPKQTPDYHAHTPAFASDKLAMRMGFGVGFGNKEISADLMSFHAEASYSFLDAVFGSFRYTSLTGVKTNDDRSYVAQSYLFGGGMEKSLDARNRARIRGGAYFGMTKFSNWDLVIFAPGKTTYAVTPGATASFDYDLFQKCFVTAGAGAQFGKAAWYDVQVGFGARF
jgi:hypothetical protein